VQRSWVRSGAYLVTIVFFGLALLGVAGRAAAPPGTHREGAVATAGYMYPLYLLLPRPRVTGFYENTASTPGGVGSYHSFVVHGRTVNVVAPRWYAIGPAGNVARDMSDGAVTLAAMRDHVAVMPLVTNLGSNFLTSPGARAAAVRSLVRIASKSGYRGVYLDFELLPANARPGMTALVQELHLRLHAAGRQLGVAVFPKVGLQGTLADAYNYAALAKSSDQVALMTYDHHYDGGAPGPVAPFAWVDANVLYALRYVPRGHLYMGLAFYGYDWGSPSGGSATTLSQPEAYALAKAHGVPVQYDPASGEGHFTYQAAGSTHVVWFETPRSIAEKSSLARRYGVGGVAIWRLGFEAPGTWTTMMKAVKTGRTPPLPTGAQMAASGGVLTGGPAA